MAVWLSGCTRTPPKAAPPVPVKGKILDAKGNPLALVLVSFWPKDRIDPTTPEHYDDATDKNGLFAQMKCPPGEYRVTVSKLPIQRSQGDLTAAPLGSLLTGTDARYGDSQKTPWSVTVPEGGKDDVQLAMK
jgi:hypothetical protein